MGQLRQRGNVWWIRYYRNGKRYEESAHTEKKGVAQDVLRTREGDIVKGVPVTAKMGRLKIDDALADVETDYRVNGKRSLDVVERRIKLHLLPYFGGRRASDIRTSDVTAFVERRQKAGASNGEINRELTILKRAFSLAVKGGILMYRPNIELLRENNTRTGFFELEQYRDVQAHLPAELRPIVEFAYITGWRVASEVLPLEWRNVDFKAGEVRLDAGTTKNGEGRIFPMTDDLRALLEARQRETKALEKQGQIVARVFFRMIAEGRRGKKKPRAITSFLKAWKAACKAAGCPGRIPHDLRRTAVRNMVRRGVPERVAMKLTGHKTRSIFERYNIVSGGDLRTAALQLQGLTGTEKGQSSTTAASATPRLA